MALLLLCPLVCPVAPTLKCIPRRASFRCLGTTPHRFPSLSEALGDPACYEVEIDRLRLKHLHTSRLYEIEQDEVSLASICLHAREVARMLAASVSSGDHHLAPARVRTIVVRGKARTVFSLPLTDAVVGAAVARELEERAEGVYSDALYSYRRGRSFWTAIASLATYVRRHRSERSDPRSRGLWVLGRDISAYTDSIPLGERSRIWPMLAALGGSGALVEQVVRPIVSHPGTGEATQLVGVATGQPISCLLFNLYLHDLDHEIAAIEGGFFARYCDDLVFAHSDLGVVRAVERRLDGALAERGLRFDPRKGRNLYLNGAGRPAPEEGFHGATAVPFLGCDVRADGTVALGARKGRELVRDLAARIERSARLLRALEPERRGPLLCDVVRRAMEPIDDGTRPHAMALARRAVTDRSSLKALDHEIARMVAGAVTGRPGPRAFREAPPRRLYGEWRLPSLVHARNRWGRRA